MHSPKKCELKATKYFSFPWVQQKPRNKLNISRPQPKRLLSITATVCIMFDYEINMNTKNNSVGDWRWIMEVYLTLSSMGVNISHVQKYLHSRSDENDLFFISLFSLEYHWWEIVIDSHLMKSI